LKSVAAAALPSDDAEFLRAVGRRVRDLRERRDLTRRVLAAQADVSERYLGQLETGEGNISIMLLRRVALALDVPLAELLETDPDSVEKQSIRRFLRQIPRYRIDDLLVRLVREVGSEREARRRKDENLRFDSVWYVFDVDEHPFVPESKQQAKAHAINLAVSNPCFELWFLLHFQDQTAHIERQTVQRLCREHMPDYQKTPPCDVLRPLQNGAIQRAIRLGTWQESRGNAGGNPSTGVYSLVQQIQAASRT